MKRIVHREVSELINEPSEPLGVNVRVIFVTMASRGPGGLDFCTGNSFDRAMTSINGVELMTRANIPMGYNTTPTWAFHFFNQQLNDHL